VNSWPHVQIGDLCKIVGGGTPKRDIEAYYGGEIPWVTPKDMKQWNIKRSKVSLTELGLRESAARLVPLGSVLVVVRSGVLKHTLPVGIARNPVAINQDMKALICGPRLNSDYLAHYIRAQAPVILKWVRATTADNFSIEKLKELSIPLPPLEEQERIVSILDHADTLRAKRREAIAHLDELTQSIFIDMFGDPVVNRKAFPVVPLTQVGHLYSGGTPSKATPGNWEGSLPWFSPKDLKRDDLFDSQDHINERITELTSLKLIPPNTVVFVVRGMILAHSFPVSILRVQATINQDMKAVLPSIDVTSDFLAHNLRVQTNNILAQVSTAGHGTKRLDSDGMSRIPVLLPPIELQREFDARIEIIRHLRTRHQVALSSLDMLFSALQARLFRGAL